ACVLRHEQEHLRRGDVWWMLLVQLVRAVWWFHPLVHRLASRFLQECEHVCDEAVVRSGVAPELYARTMLELADAPGRSVTPTAFLGVSPSRLRLRVAAILRELESGRVQFKTLGWISLTMLAVLAAVFTMLHFDGESSSSAKTSIETEAKLRLRANPFPGNE
ncbi:MAG: M56 family metallopeptidase, partial [Verrucomicrobia bacterium]|nr:M56 family metallopeptidase [Verrucomicrobiota bacterium]